MPGPARLSAGGAISRDETMTRKTIVLIGLGAATLAAAAVIAFQILTTPDDVAPQAGPDEAPRANP